MSTHPGTCSGLVNITHIEGPALVYDDTGTFEAISVADILLQKGVHVTMVSRNDSVGARLNYPPVTAGAARERLYSGDFDLSVRITCLALVRAKWK